MDDLNLDKTASTSLLLIPEIVNDSSSDDSFERVNKMYPELNLGLAIPIVVRSRSSRLPQTEMSTEVKTSSPDGSIFKIKITAKNESGELITGFDESVIDVLTTCLRDQFFLGKTVLGEDLGEIWDADSNPDFVFVDDLTVTKLLGISANSRSKVKASFHKLRKVLLDISSFQYKGKDGQIYKNAGKDDPILGGTFENTFVDLKSGETRTRKYIRIHRTIAENVRNELFTEVDLARYQGLKAGPQRRLYVFLKSKQKAFGNLFSFDMFEIERIFGLADHPRSREYLKSYLEDLESLTKDFSYLINRDTVTGQYEVKVEFYTEKLLPVRDLFLHSLEIVYGAEVLNELGLDIHTVSQYKKDYGGKYKRRTGKEVVLVFGLEHDPVELCLAISLDAYIKSGKVNKFGAYFGSLIENLINEKLIIPVGFKCVYSRASVIIKKQEEKRAIELRDQRLEREKKEEAQYNANVMALTSRLYENKELKAKATRLAKLRLHESGIDSDNISYNFLLGQEIQNVFKFWIEDCDGDDKILKAGDLLLLGNEFEENLTLKMN